MCRLVLLFSFLLFFSCKKEGKGLTNFSILGKWQVIATRSSSPFDCGCWKSLEADDRAIYHFKADGTYTSTFPLSSNYSDCTANYQVKDDSVIVWQKCNPDGVASSGMYHDAISFEANDLVIETIGIGGPTGTLFRKVQ